MPTRTFATEEIIVPMRDAGFNVSIVGSLSKQELSSHDIDILLKVPCDPEFIVGKSGYKGEDRLSEKVFRKFENKLKRMGWEYQFSDEISDEEGEGHKETLNSFSIFHNYAKYTTGEPIGLDVFLAYE
jgi:hypothetical protein